MHSRELPIRFPCPAPGPSLTVEAGRLHCAACDREVIELDRLSEAEVRSLRKRARKGERICVRYRADEDGLIQLRRSRPLRPLRAAAAAAGLASLLACGAAGADASLPRAAGSTAAQTAAPAPARLPVPVQARLPAKGHAAPPTAPKAPQPKVKRWEQYDGGL
jgi:hypothetical protein